MAGQMWDLAATPIGKAIAAGDVDEVNRLIQGGEDVHYKDRKGNTYFHYISTMYQPSVFYALAAAGVDIFAQNRHGNTALHVTALQNECCHVGDLLACGIDPFIRNKFGKMASELGTQNKYWHMIHEKYKPGIFQVVKDHDLPRLRQLLHCWCRVEVIRNKQNLRQYAALLTYHDIVVMIDQHKPTMDMIYGVFEGNHEKVEEALKKTRCKVNFLNEISQKRHILQYAIEFQDLKFVQMLCAAGADVNMRTHVKHYFWGPMYFAAIRTDIPLKIMWHVLKAGADFTAKDERGRTAFMYALDKGNGNIPLEIFDYMLQNGTDITQRDCTGCQPRDIARFAQRRDVVELIDKYYIKILRKSQMERLNDMAVMGYDSLFITYNYRDTFIYAAGNQTGDVSKFIEWVPPYRETVRKLHNAITNQTLDVMTTILSQCESPELVIRGRNKARRTPLIQACLQGKGDVVVYILSLPYDVEVNAQDCMNCTAYHFACALSSEEGETIREKLLEAGADADLLDAHGRTAEHYKSRSDREAWLNKERKAIYGMDLELASVDKYEELRKIIRGKRKGLKEFMDGIRGYNFPVVALYKVLSPLMPEYRDLIFLAIDYGKLEIAYRLSDLGADLGRREKYERKVDGDQTTRVQYYSPAERADHLGMYELAQYLRKKRSRQLEKLRSKTPLLSRRATQRHLEQDLISCVPSSAVFVTQRQMTTCR